MWGKSKLSEYSESSDEDGEGSDSKYPEWVPKLVQEKNFFKDCEEHSPCNINFFCPQCSVPLCGRCIKIHDNHHRPRCIKIVKRNNNNAVNILDLQGVINCDVIESHIKGGGRVVHITNNSADATEKSRGPKNPCFHCRIPVPKDKMFCSLGCMVKDSEGDPSPDKGEAVEAPELNVVSNVASSSGTTATKMRAIATEASGSGTVVASDSGTTATEMRAIANEASGSGTVCNVASGSGTTATEKRAIANKGSGSGTSSKTTRKRKKPPHGSP